MKKQLMFIALLWVVIAMSVVIAVIHSTPVHAQTKETGSQHAVTYTFPALSTVTSTPWIWVGDTAPTKHAIVVVTTGAPTFGGNLEGSLDGVTATTIVAGATTTGTVAWESTGAKPVLYVRYTLTSLSGGTATPIYLGSN
jgi:hypothetical protein